MVGPRTHTLPVGIVWVTLTGGLLLVPSLAWAVQGPAGHPVATPLPDRSSLNSHRSGEAAPTTVALTAPPAVATRVPVSEPRTSSVPAVGPLGSPVNPFLAHSKEPAPMGIADFGVTGSGVGSTAYAYTTSSLEASALVRSMHITFSSGSSTYHTAAFELNAVLIFRLGGANYSYWIQNGLHVDSSTNEYTIGGAYVWNFSSSSAGLTSSELQGNASSVLYPDTYIFIPSCTGFAGQCSTLSLPATLTARIAISTCGSYPCVTYQYNLGAGWVTYDSVSFLHMASASVVGFQVDGSRYTPLGTGTFYDAEWVWVAAGGGVSGRDDGSNLELALDYWNGHNYQPVPGAWNFGGDTGESSYNVTNTLDRLASDGAPRADLTSGSGTLGVLYNASDVGFLNVSAPVVSPATLQIDGNPAPFQGGWANLTLVAGAYSVSLQNYSNASARVTLQPGQTAALNLSGAGLTIFEATGLAARTPWGITVGGFSRSGAGALLSFNLPNETYSITYAFVPGFHRYASAPVNVQVPALSPIVVDWYRFTYAVAVAESGLPAATPWWVNASGTLVQANGTTLFVAAPNGSTPFTVGSAYEFVADPGQGTIVVTAGAFSAVVIQFAYRPTYIVGTVTPSGAHLTIDGLAVGVSAGQFNASVIPGSYTLEATAPGYRTQSVEVNATPGNVTVQDIALSPNSSHGSVPSSAPAPGVGIWVWVAVGVGVVALGAALAVVLARRSRSP